MALAYELGVSVATVNQIQAKRITAAEQAQLMLKLWKTQSGTKAHGLLLFTMKVYSNLMSLKSQKF